MGIPGRPLNYKFLLLTATRESPGRSYNLTIHYAFCSLPYNHFAAIGIKS